MTNEEALSICRLALKCFANRQFNENEEAVTYLVERYDLETMVNALEKQEKYRWHDLRKNPDDLPNEDLFFNSLLCVNENGYYLTYCDLYYDNDNEWFEAESESVYLTNVIAWKEIEPFEEGDTDEK